MKVNINHEEMTTGFISKTKHYGVKILVEFSAVEEAIIKERELTRTIVLERGLPSNHTNRAARELAEDGLYNLTIYSLLSGENTYYCATPADAKAYEAGLREALPELKEYIMDNESIENKSDSFEL